LTNDIKEWFHHLKIKIAARLAVLAAIDESSPLSFRDSVITNVKILKHYPVTKGAAGVLHSDRVLLTSEIHHHRVSIVDIHVYWRWRLLQKQHSLLKFHLMLVKIYLIHVEKNFRHTN